MTDQVSETADSPQPRRVKRVALLTGIVALAGLTAYLLTMGVLWHLHMSDLRAAQQELEADLTSTSTTLEETNERLEASRGELDASLTAITESADDKANARDNQLLLLDMADYMAECANEAEELVKVVYNRHIYVAWTVIRYENDLKDYCSDVSEAFRDLLSEIEEES